MSTFAPILAALVGGGGRFVIVGGLATVLHGYARLTVDVDVMVDLDAGEAIKPIAALARIGMVPRAPVDARDFADPDIRRRWIEEKGMRVFSMWDPRRPLLEVDIFVDPPLPFAEVWSRAVAMDVAGSTVRVASIADLVVLKRIGGRPKDLADISALKEIAERTKR